MKRKVKQKKIDLDEFLKEREEVLSMWPTGRDVDLDEAIGYQKSLPESKIFLKVVEKLRKEGRTVVFPRAGTPILEQEIALNKSLVEAGLVLIPVTTDSYSRLCRFDKAQAGLEESIRTGRVMLNGYPIVNHGVSNTRKLVESCEAALDPRLSNLDNRLIVEIALASGMTGALLDPLMCFGSYEKTPTVAQVFSNYQYMHRLVGYYAEKGAIITVDLDSWLPHAPFPQSNSIVSLIVDALIAAEQGVKSIVPWSPCYGNMMQDIACARVIRKLVRECLDNFGYADVIIPGLFVDRVPLLPFPLDTGGAFAQVSYAATVAALIEAEAVFVASIDEAAGVPTKEAHIVSYNAAHWILNVMREQRIQLQNEQTDMEEKIFEIEVRAILDKILDLGDGDIVEGYIRAVDVGVVDSPWCININVKGNASGIRDNNGACRYLDFGNLPIPEEAKEFHREKVSEREKAEGRKMDYSVAVEDFWALSQGRIKGIPAL